MCRIECKRKRLKAKFKRTTCPGCKTLPAHLNGGTVGGRYLRQRERALQSTKSGCARTDNQNTPKQSDEWMQERIQIVLERRPQNRNK